MKPTFSLTGSSALDGMLAGLPEDVRKKILAPALRTGGERIATRAGELAPGPSKRHQEHLKDNIEVRAATAEDLADSGADTVGVVIGPSKKVFYGSFAEFGTSHQPARPWLRPAYDSEAEGALSDIASEVGAGVAALAGKNGGEQ